MNLLDSRFFRVYIIPGAVLQSVMVGGGYGTGREIVEYFTQYGFLGGLLGLGISLTMLAVVIALTFELSRLYKVYDYRNFIKQLLGQVWFIFEIMLVLMLLLVMAVLAAACGNILQDNFGIPYAVGILGMMLVVGGLTFYGRDMVAKALTYWSFYLYGVFIVMLLAVFNVGGKEILHAVQTAEIVDGWAVSGFKYAMYNLAGIPALLYIARVFETRREAMTSGVIAAVIALLPALAFHIAFLSSYPAIIDQAIPVYWLMGKFGMSILLVFYSVMLFGTFIETGAGSMQGLNERIDARQLERGRAVLNPWMHGLIAIFVIGLSALLSQVGITNLIAKGYGTLAWGFMLVYVLPLLTIGVYKVVVHNRDST